MKNRQEQVFTTTEIENLLNEEFKKFEKKWHGIMGQSEYQTLAKFMEQVKEEINKPVTNPC